MSKEKFQANQKVKLALKFGDDKTVEYDAIISPGVDEELKKSFNLNVSKDVLENAKEAKLASIAPQVNLNGFRPGKAPLSVVWKQYQDKVTSELVDAFINQAIKEIRTKESADLAIAPNVEIKKFSFEEGLEFDVTLELMPKIELPELKKISLAKPVFEIKDADIDARIKELSSVRKNFVPAKDTQKAAMGDQVVIDFEGKIDGVAFPGGAAKGHILELGSKAFIDNFEDQLVGHKKGSEVTVKVTFPENYHEKKYAGKAAEFAVNVTEVREAKPYENDEDLAKAMQFKDLNELKEKIKDSLNKECLSKANVKMKIELFDKLDELCNFELPQKLLDEEFNLMWKQAEEMQKSSDDNKKTEAELKEEYQKLAKRRVKLGLLLTQFANKYDVKVDQQDFINAVRAQIDSQHPALAQTIIDYYSKNPKAVEALRGPILEEKAVAAILKDVTLSEQAFEVKKLLELGQ